MKKNFHRNILISALVLIFGLFLTATPANADMGIAPPSMHFSLVYKIPQTEIIQANLLLCEDSECEKNQIFETVDFYSYNLPNFYCGNENDGNWCYAGIGDDNFGKYHRISLSFADGVTRTSNVFKKRGYSSFYTVVVNDKDLLVEEIVAQNWSPFNLFTPLQVSCFIPSAIFTLVTEVWIAKRFSKKIKKPIRHIVLANLISLPIVWFIIPNWLMINFLWTLVIVETFAIIFEAAFLFYVNRTSGFTLKEGAITSIIINLASIGLGVLLIGILYLIFFIFIR